ncbi:MAG: hypothetical protein AB4372_07315 [Xenococcus sp. (in: cyanobacteria)]
MKEPIFNQSPSQKASNQEGNLTQVGRDYTNTTNTNFFIIGVLAMGGLALAFYFGWIESPNNNQKSNGLSLLQNQTIANKSLSYLVSIKEEH